MNGLFLERGTAENGNQFNFAGEPADGRLENRRGNRFFFEHEVRDFVVLVGNGVNQFRKRGLGTFLMLGGDFFDLIIETFIRLARPPINGLLIDDVNHALKTAVDRFAFNSLGPWPNGRKIGNAYALSLVRMSFSAFSKFAPMRSILLTNAMRGT